VARAISADGPTVVGYSLTGTYGKPLQEVYRWTEETGMVGLGFYGWAWDVSADGSVIVGMKSDWVFVWDQEHGVRERDDILLDGGVDLTGWNIWTACGVSADGQTIVGAAYNPEGKLEAYVAHIPEPGTWLCSCTASVHWRAVHAAGIAVAVLPTALQLAHTPHASRWPRRGQ